MSFNASSSAVIHCFQAFYYELLRQKEKALSLYLSSSNTKINDDKYDKELEGLIVTIQKKLINTIETVNNTLIERSRLSPNNIRDVRYIMAVLADETFINLNWEGTEIWKLYLLEKNLFKTEIAGDKFFDMADNTLNDLNNEEMAFMYLVALSLGFEGKYRNVENSEEYLNWYKSKLYAIIHFNKEKLFYPGRQHLINSCYDYTCTEGTNKLLPDTNHWIITIIVILILYIIISYFIWFNITGDINTTMKYMHQQVYASSKV